MRPGYLRRPRAARWSWKCKLTTGPSKGASQGAFQRAFSRWGRLVARKPLAVIAISFCLALLCMARLWMSLGGNKLPTHLLADARISLGCSYPKGECCSEGTQHWHSPKGYSQGVTELLPAVPDDYL